MTELAYGCVCANAHITPVSEADLSLLELSGCQDCGQTVHRRCPDCDAPVRIRTAADGPSETGQWEVNDFCPDCGAAYPWGPGRVGRFVHTLVDRGTGEPTPTPGEEVFSVDVMRYLRDTKYGEELIAYARDGDRCYRNRLWFPADHVRPRHRVGGDHFSRSPGRSRHHREGTGRGGLLPQRW